MLSASSDRKRLARTLSLSSHRQSLLGVLSVFSQACLTDCFSVPPQTVYMRRMNVEKCHFMASGATKMTKPYIAIVI